MAHPSSLRECRFQVSTTHRTSQLNAGGDDWNVSNASVSKLRCTAIDTTGLTQPGIDDETIQTRMHTKPAMIEGLAKGSIKISTYAGGAWDNLGVSPEWNMAAACAGGLAVPTNARSGTGGTSPTTVNISFDDINSYILAGQALLLGVRGDGRGGGELKPVNAVSVDHAGLSIAASVAPDGDTVVCATTIYPDEDATQQYIDLLAVGHGAADQVQAIGAAGTIAMTGTGGGDPPKLDFDLMVSDWAYCAAGSRTTLDTGNTPQGGTPAFHKAIGLAHIGDQGSSTRVAYKVADVTFDPGLAYEEVPCPDGVNGVGARQHMPGVPTLEFTILLAEDDGVIDDFPDTAKHVLVQLGHEATKTIAIELQNAYIDERPTRVDIGNLTGWRVKVHGTELGSGTDLEKAAWRIHVC